MPRVGKDVFGFSNMRDIDKSEFDEVNYDYHIGKKNC